MPVTWLSLPPSSSGSLPAAEPCRRHADGAEDAEQEHSPHAGEGPRPRQFRAADSGCVVLEETQHFYGEQK